MMAGHTVRNEDGPVKGTADKRGSNEPTGFEHESFEAQAVLLQFFPYLRALHPVHARRHGYEV